MSDKIKIVYSIPCQKVIIAENGETSFIGLIETVEVGVIPQAPKKFIAPMKWHVVVLWARVDEKAIDVTQYEQKIVLRDMDGDEVFVGEHKFDTPADYVYFRNVADFPGIPIAKTGYVNVETYLREKASDDWKQHFSYRIHVKRHEVNANADQDQPKDQNDNDESNHDANKP